ncbi:MAG: alpha/beta-hydrolase family protein [Acidimicrobiia bacterium]|nr:alpha/beta-hydrolase family protein [Acidimicrobiia bacterium]
MSVPTGALGSDIVVGFSGSERGARGSDLWLHRPDVFAGALLGTVAAARSFEPSLMPRTTGHQALVSGASGAMGFALGGAVYGLAARTSSLPADLAVTSGLAASGFVLSRSLPVTDAERHGNGVVRPVLRTVGDCLAAGGLAAAGVVVARGSQRRFVGVSIVAGGASLVAANSVIKGLRAQKAALGKYDPPPPRPLPALGRSLAVGGVLLALVNGYRRSGHAVARILHQRVGLDGDVSVWWGDLIAFGLWVGSVRTFSHTFVNGLRMYDRVVDPGYDRPPSVPVRTAGPGSILGFARAGREGRRFVLDAPTPQDIERVMGRPAVAEPVRVYVGYANTKDDDERIELAMSELHRTGAFDRSLLVVGCPAGNGLVNRLPLEVLDYVLAGDTASVAVQYGQLPSLLTLHRVGRGARLHRRLLESIHAELLRRPATHRPTVVVYGESLGAWAGQDAFLGEGVDGLDRLGVSRALWVGTPYYSGWRRQVLVDRTVDVPDGSVIEIEGAADLVQRAEPLDQGRLRVTIVGHDNDPVRYLEAGVFVRRPPWLAAERPRRVPDRMRWFPGITAAQLVVDAVNATRPVPGVFRATGHEYNGDLPEVVLAAYGIERPDLETWARLIEHLAANDAARAAALRRLPEASGP